MIKKLIFIYYLIQMILAQIDATKQLSRLSDLDETDKILSTTAQTSFWGLIASASLLIIAAAGIILVCKHSKIFISIFKY
jgi:hypothetical protein